MNIIERGKNCGWPVIVHGIDYPGKSIREGITHKEGMEEPAYYWDPVIAPSGLAFCTGSLFPQWKGIVRPFGDGCEDCRPPQEARGFRWARVLYP
jgi:glucose/arabinose dehydrogenase